MKKTQNKLLPVLYIITALTLCFIWGQSCMSSKDSGNESQFVTEEIVQPIEEKITGKRTITDAVVRKWAHGIEYSVLGAELALMLARKPRWKTLPRIFSYGVAAAFVDETIQIFSKRGPQIKDMWIDALGLTLGMLAGCALRALVRRKASARKASRQASPKAAPKAAP